MRNFRNDGPARGLTAVRGLVAALAMLVAAAPAAAPAGAAGDAPPIAAPPIAAPSTLGPPLRLGVPQRLTPPQRQEPPTVGPVRPAGALPAERRLGELLAEMDRLGIILDATHLCDESFWEALDHFDGPVWASHSIGATIDPIARVMWGVLSFSFSQAKGSLRSTNPSPRSENACVRANP